MAVTILLEDPVPLESDPDPFHYTGRWVLTVDPFSLPAGMSGNVNGIDIVITSLWEADTWITFSVVNDSETPADLTAGFVYDSDSPPAWETGAQSNRFGPGGNEGGGGFLPPIAEEVTLYDAPDWDPFELPGGFTIDPESHPSWFTYTPPPPPPQYEVVVVDQDGTPFGTAGNARIGKVSWELNGPGAADFTLATTDPDAEYFQPGREVQVYYQGGTDPIWWGPIVRPRAGLNESTWQCAGLLWYFAHRFMGRADRVNQLTNGDFEAGETDWTFHNSVGHEIDSDVHIEEPTGQSLKLTGATADHDGYASQTWTHPVGGHPLGDWLTGSVWVFIPSADFLGGALDDFGLLLRHRDPDGNIITTEGGPGSALPALIGDDTPKDQWIELETGVPFVHEGDTVEVLLFPPHGVAHFDLATLTYMESLTFPSSEVDSGDVTDIIGGIVDYAQDRLPFDHGKSDLNIGTAGSDTGVTRRIAYQFAEHRNVLDAIMEFVRQGVCDIDIEITSTTRTFTVYPKSADSRDPKLGKGTLYGTTLELDENIADFDWSWDLEQGASTVVLLGPGDGPDRPEGGANDTSLLDGAFTIEIVEQAPDDTTVGQLDQRAAERLAVATRPEILQLTTLPGAGVIGNIVVGDTVNVDVACGWVAVTGVYRVVRMEADLFSDQATLTLNAVTEAS